jgi:SSS family transporter
LLDYQISSIDLVVVALYLCSIFYLAFRSGKLSGDQEAEDFIEQQYLAGKSLTFWESMSSIIATEVSALTFLGIPAFAFGADFSFIQIYMGALIGRIFIAKLFLPRIYDKGITVYTVMGKKGNENGQRATAIFYFINKILAVGVRLFSGSILVAEFFNLSIYVAVGIICIITFFYTLIGGLKAVVRTDMVQMGLFILGGIVAHYLIPHIGNASWSEYMMIAYQNGKTSFLNFTNPWPFVTGVVGGILFDMATHGVDQDFAQRLTANRSMKTAQKAIIFSTFLSLAVGFLFLSIGALLWSYYQSHVPPGVPNDKLFAFFITQYFPMGLKGLMVAGVLAATMSTLDSTINALSACFYNDILHHKTHDKEKISKLYKKDTLIITVLLMLVAFIAAQSDGLLILGLKITSWTAGSLLALFFATVIWHKFTKVKLDAPAVFWAYAVGILGVYVNNNLLEWAWQWNVYWGFILATFVLTIKGRLIDTKKAI